MTGYYLYSKLLRSGVSRHIGTGGYDKPINEKTLAHSLSNLVKEDSDGKLTLFGLDPFAPHDLRRSFGSGAAALKVQRLIIGKVLNHSDGTSATNSGSSKTTAIYDRYKYYDEKRETLELWAKHLEEIIK